MTSLSDRLEAQARRLRRSRQGRRPQQDRSLPLSWLEREIEVTSESLSALRRAHHERFRQLKREECAIDTSLKQLRSYLPRIYEVSGRSRDRLQQRTAALASERRSFSQRYDSDARALRERLFELLKQHAILTGGEYT